MRLYLTPLLQLQRFILPALIGLALWAIWRTVWKKDQAVGLALYLGLIIVVDGFLNTGIFIPGLEKGSIRYSEVCAFILLINRPPGQPRRMTHGAVRALVGLYFVLLLLSVFRATPIMAGAMDFRVRIVPQILAFTIAARGLRSPQDFRRFLLCLMCLAFFLALFTFWDLFFDRWLLTSSMLEKPEYWTNRKHGRYGSILLNPNYLGAFVVLLVPSVFVATLNEKAMKLKAFAGVVLLALIFSLVETQSRGPMLAFALGLILLLLGPAGKVSRTKRFGIFLPFVVLFTLLMPGFYDHAIERFQDLDKETTTEGRSRQTVWLFTQRIIADHPLTGIGFGEQQFLGAMEEYGYSQEYGEGSLDNPHNSYLQMTVYAGFPALIVFLLANGLLLLRAVGSVLERHTDSHPEVAFGLMVGVTGYLAVIYPDMHMFTQTVAPVYWVLAGLLLSLTTLPRAAAAKAFPLPAAAPVRSLPSMPRHRPAVR